MEEQIRAARASEQALGRLLARYSHYLTILASVEVGRRLQGKLDPADLVQDVFLDAARHFAGFRGETEGELTAWLRQILAGVLGNTLRRYFGTQARDARLEHDLRAAVDQSSCILAGQLAAPDTSPSEVASRREQAVLFADAMAQLPEHYRQVILLRHLEALPFATVAERMGRTVDSVEKIWMRALVKLREEFSRIAGSE